MRQLDVLSHSLSMASIAENIAGDSASARRLLDEAQLVTTGLDDLPATLGLLQARALNGFFEGDLESARSATSEGVRLSREAGDLYVLEVMLGELGGAALIAGDLDKSKPLYAEALRIAPKIDDRLAQFFTALTHWPAMPPALAKRVSRPSSWGRRTPYERGRARASWHSLLR